MLEGRRLTHAEEFANLLHVRAVNEGHMVKVALLLLGLLGQDVTVISVVTLDLTCSGECETLLGTGISLYFSHLVNWNCD